MCGTRHTPNWVRGQIHRGEWHGLRITAAQNRSISFLARSSVSACSFEARDGEANQGAANVQPLTAIGEGSPAFHHFASFLDHASAVVGRLGLVLDGMRQGGLAQGPDAARWKVAHNEFDGPKFGPKHPATGRN
jgi:hypothetical protein